MANRTGFGQMATFSGRESRGAWPHMGSQDQRQPGQAMELLLVCDTEMTMQLKN